MKKRKVSYNLPEDLLDRIEELPRKELPNKSKLIEQLLEKWLEERNRIPKKLS